MLHAVYDKPVKQNASCNELPIKESLTIFSLYKNSLCDSKIELFGKTATRISEDLVGNSSPRYRLLQEGSFK